MGNGKDKMNKGKQLLPLPPFDDLVRNYDTSHDFAAVKNGIFGVPGTRGVPDMTWLGVNTCVMRLSKAFNYAGSSFRIVPGAGMHVEKGLDKLWYGYRVAEFKVYLQKIYGEPILLERGADINMADFGLKRGIIGFDVAHWNDATGHFSLWDGVNVLYQGDHDYFDMPRSLSEKGPVLTQAELWQC